MASIAFVNAGHPNAAKEHQAALAPAVQHHSQGPPLTALPRPLSDAAEYNISQFTQRVEIYRGSVASVFKALHTKTGSTVVLKIYYQPKMQPKHHHKLQREIEAMKKMNGPFVTKLLGVFLVDDTICLVMEHCEGGDLFKTLLRHGGRMQEQWVCTEIIAPLLRALEKMHKLGMMHRDIKPENIFLVARDAGLRLGDFGLAMDWRRELPFSRSGTLDYMAPEVLINPATSLQESPVVKLADLEAKGIRPFCTAVDVWAVGVLAYELVGGRPPFEVEDEAKTVANIIYSNTIQFTEFFSPQLSDFVRHALIKDPKKRPDAAKLLMHPWIQTNLQASVSSARTITQRLEREELLHPLPLTHLELSGTHIPTTTAAAATTTHWHQTAPSVKAPAFLTRQPPAVPLTPQPVRPGPIQSAAKQAAGKSPVQRVHSSHRRDESSPPGTPAGTLAPCVQRQHSCPPHQMQPPVALAMYRPSPLSRAGSGATAPYTPTKVSAPRTIPPAAAGEAKPLRPVSLFPAGQREEQLEQLWQLPQDRSSPQRMMPSRAAPPPPARSTPGDAPVDPMLTIIEELQQRLGVLTDPGSVREQDLLSAQQLELMLQEKDGHGIVQVSRSTAKAAAASVHASPEAPAVEHGNKKEGSPSSCMPLLQRLCIPGRAGEDAAAAVARLHGSPGPAGPGIKERVKWHLSRQPAGGY